MSGATCNAVFFPYCNGLSLLVSSISFSLSFSFFFDEGKSSLDTTLAKLLLLVLFLGPHFHFFLLLLLAFFQYQVMIYNLPETVREADIEKLSFAVDLAQEFHFRVEGQDSMFLPAKLLWLIQRDFLQGKTVQEMVDAALHPGASS